MKPEDVFTPRSAAINVAMYVPRPPLELSLQHGLRGNLHLLLHGESGTGKSWLYKKVFLDSGVTYFSANLANASRFGSISNELRSIVDKERPTLKTGYEEEKSANLNAGVAAGGLSHKGEFSINRPEALDECFSLLRQRAGANPAVLVLDNLEAAFNDDKLLKELADIIILCDDERYARYSVKILIVGVPGDVKEYYYRTPHTTSVANRIHEMPEVARLSSKECGQLVKRGFDTLGYTIDDFPRFAQRVAWLSDRVPQLVHEYCLEVAMTSEDTRRVTSAHCSVGEMAWIQKNLYYAYAVIESNMNEKETKAGRRNQTLFTLGLCDSEQFKASEVEAKLRSEFPVSTAGTTLNVAQTLSQLAESSKPVVKRSPKGDAFTFVDGRYRSVLRAMLVKEVDERVSQRRLSR